MGFFQGLSEPQLHLVEEWFKMVIVNSEVVKSGDFHQKPLSVRLLLLHER